MINGSSPRRTPWSRSIRLRAPVAAVAALRHYLCRCGPGRGSTAGRKPLTFCGDAARHGVALRLVVQPSMRWRGRIRRRGANLVTPGIHWEKKGKERGDPGPAPTPDPPSQLGHPHVSCLSHRRRRLRGSRSPIVAASGPLRGGCGSGTRLWARPRTIRRPSTFRIPLSVTLRRAPYIAYTDLGVCRPTSGGETTREATLSVCGLNFGTNRRRDHRKMLLNDVRGPTTIATSVPRAGAPTQQLTVQWAPSGKHAAGAPLPIKVG